MRRWQKILLGLVVILALLIGGAAFYMNDILRATAQSVATRTLGTEVSIGSVKLQPFKQQFTVRNIRVANLSGYDSENILSIDRIFVRVEDLFVQPVIIDEISYSGLALVLEINENGMNLRKLQQQISTSASNPPGSNTEQTAKNPKARAAANMPVMIRQLNITNISAHARASFAGQSKSQTVRIGDIQLKDIGKGDSATPPQVISKVLNALIPRVIEAAPVSQLKNVQEELESGIKSKSGDIKKKAGEALKGIFE